MIFILSTKYDNSTDEVLRYLILNNITFYRFDLIDLFFSNLIKIEVNNRNFSIRIDNYYITEENLSKNVFWFRRQSSFKESENYAKVYKSLGSSILNLIHNEYVHLRELFFLLLKDAKWLSYPVNINKGYVLYKAAKSGLKIPNSLITDSKVELERFITKNKKRGYDTICKPIGDSFDIKINKIKYLISPHIIDSTEKLPYSFFPSLVQKYINKEFDIRVFYINNKFYASAIFSQKHIQTKTDFRINTDSNCKLRISSFKLPIEIEYKINNLMNSLNLNTGSIDLLYFKRYYYFLEINPNGQFGEYANISGYNLYEIIAEELIKLLNYEK